MKELVSVIVPCLNEVKKLPENLSRLLAADTVAEIIVVDGGSTDGTLQAVEDLITSTKDPRLSLYQCSPGRALQMNYGAARANAQWLLFHHADSFIDRVAVDAIVQGRGEWGGFLHSFTPSNWKLRIVSWLHNFRWRQTGIVYGDQSMFVRRSFFKALGGFKEGTIEDLEFSDRAVEAAASIMLPYYVQTDSRKFIQMGEFRALWQVCVILWRYERNRKVGKDEFFKPYR